MPTLQDLLLRLVEAEIEFVVIGGYAGVLHGSSLVTRDLDICAVLTEANLERLRAALRDLHPCHRMATKPLSFIDIPPPGQVVKNLYLRTDWGVVDILTDVHGVGNLMALMPAAETVQMGGKAFRLIGLRDLIRAKEALGREKDLLAAKELRAIAALRHRSSDSID